VDAQDDRRGPIGGVATVTSAVRLPDRPNPPGLGICSL
jgi:hypothetical protein